MTFHDRRPQIGRVGKADTGNRLRRDRARTEAADRIGAANRNDRPWRSNLGRAVRCALSFVLVKSGDHDWSLRALEISASVAFSESLTATPPIPRNPPSVDASATFWLI
jgi:hypothetical protein